MKRLITFIFLIAFTSVFAQTRVYNHNIEGKGWIQFTDTLKADFSIQDYYIASRSGDRLSFIAADSNNIVDLFGGDGDGLEEIIWNLWGKGTPADITQAHWLRLWYNLAQDEYCITTKQSGAQSYKELLLAADGSNTQFRLHTDGDISFDDTLKGGTYTGTFVGSIDSAYYADTIYGTIKLAQISDYVNEAKDTTIQGIFVDTSGIDDNYVIVYDAADDTFRMEAQSGGDTVKHLAPAQITANQNDYSPTGWDNTITRFELTSDANRDITGISATGFDRTQTVVVINENAIGGGNIKFKKENAGSIAANRFKIQSDLTIEPGEAVYLIYSVTSSRWVAVTTVP